MDHLEYNCQFNNTVSLQKKLCNLCILVAADLFAQH
jgi:hypothetical protein